MALTQPDAKVVIHPWGCVKHRQSEVEVMQRWQAAEGHDVFYCLCCLGPSSKPDWCKKCLLDRLVAWCIECQLISGSLANRAKDTEAWRKQWGAIASLCEDHRYH